MKRPLASGCSSPSARTACSSGRRSPAAESIVAAAVADAAADEVHQRCVYIIWYTRIFISAYADC